MSAAFFATPEPKSPLARYVLLGNTGLRVSPICLGAMAFGTNFSKMTGDITKDEAESIFDHYVTKGGNFIDTANFYQKGQSEEWLGEWIEKRGIRDELVIATKFSLCMKSGSINSAGNSRKNMFHSIEGSLKRLRTSYVDVYYVHFWDFTTPIEEVMRGLNDLVVSGKVLYLGVSDTPAWVVARANSIAERHGWAKFVVYQGQYNAGKRDLEADIIPMCREMGLGNAPWQVLGAGKFTGRFKRGSDPGEAGRNGVTMTEKDYDIAEEVIKIAQELNKSPSQVILNWTRAQPGITSPIVGIRKLSQLQDNIEALSWTLEEQYIKRIAEKATFTPPFPHDFLEVKSTGYSRFINNAGVLLPRT